MKRVEAFNELEALQAEGRQLVNDMTDAKKAGQLEQALDDTERWAKDNEETAKVAEIKVSHSSLQAADCSAHCRPLIARVLPLLSSQLKRRQLETTLGKIHIMK